jgi:CheY-like chemotaxis protein
VDKPRRADDRGEADKRRLKELALEASRHLDFILPGGDGSETRKSGGAEHERSGGVSRTSGEAGRPSALVVHVSHGLARVLANLLTNMGVSTTIATNLKEARSIPTEGHWDLLFIQGTAMPHPGRDLAALVLDRFRRSPPPTILLARRGDTLLAGAGAFEAAGLLEWPFSPVKVEALLKHALAMAKARSHKRK